MSSTFPSTLTTYVNPQATDKLNSPSHSGIEQNQNSGLTQVEKVIGLAGSASTLGSIQYDLRSPASGGGGHIQTPQFGGTGQTSFNKGDTLVASSSSVFSKVAVGTDGQTLIADSTQTAGVRWGDNAGLTTLTQTFLSGPSILAGQPVALFPYQSDGGVLLDGITGQASNSFTVVVANNSNRLLFVTAISASGQTITGMTYNGVALTKLQDASYNSGSTYHAYIWYLIAPATGSHTLVTTTSSGTANVACYSLYNIKQSAPDSSFIQVGGTPMAASILTATNGSFVVSTAYAAGGTTAPSITGIGGWSSAAAQGNVDNALNMLHSGQVFPAQVIPITVTNFLAGDTVGAMTTFSPVASVITNTVFPASASTLTTTQFYDKYKAYVGIAAVSVGSVTSLGVVVAGSATTSSVLTYNKQYYISDTPGALSTTAASNTRKAGIAVSSTMLLVTNIW